MMMALHSSRFHVYHIILATYAPFSLSATSSLLSTLLRLHDELLYDITELEARQQGTATSDFDTAETAKLTTLDLSILTTNA